MPDLLSWIAATLGEDVAFWLGYLTNGKHLTWYASVQYTLTAAVLGYNFPGSDWYLDSYALLTGEDLRPEAHKGSWISRVWNSVF